MYNCVWTFFPFSFPSISLVKALELMILLSHPLHLVDYWHVPPQTATKPT